MAKTFHLTVAKIGETLFEGEVVSLSLPGAEGVFEILAGHEPLVSLLKKGELRVKDVRGERFHFEIPQNGVAEVSSNQATILL